MDKSELFNYPENQDSDFINSFDATKLNWSETDIQDEYNRQEKFDKKCRDTLIKARKKREKQELKQIKNKYGPQKNKMKGIDLSTTTKQLMLFIVLNCTLIEIYAMITMFKFQDLTALDALISAVVAETIAFFIYCIKSYFETKSEKNHELEIRRITTETEFQEEPGEHEFFEDASSDDFS